LSELVVIGLNISKVHTTIMNDYDSNWQQREFWKNDFGHDYVKRNFTIDDVNEEYKKETGITVEEIFKFFFNGIDKSSKILELGCNVGLNLDTLKKIGFQNLTGLEINPQTTEIAKKRNPDINFINSSIEDFFEHNKFDLVFTSGVLIHINPDSINKIITKIVGLSTKYIFGFEYFSEILTTIPYRGNDNVCWKQNFPLSYKKLFPNIKTIKEEKFFYKNNELCDIAYLLEK
jgi:pseudaminic acid biosynthesis-associated methylase